MKIFAILLIGLGIATGSAAAQLKKTRWELPSCRFEGTYNAKKHTAAQLQNTFRMWGTQDFDLDTIDATAFTIDQISKLRTVESLESEYERTRAALAALQIVKTPYWTAYKERKLKALRQEFELARSAVLAYGRPAALNEVKFAEACVTRFAPPLVAGGDELLRIWREVNTELRSRNASPDAVRAKFEQQAASPDRFKYAQVEVITFGWWNCVNGFIDRGDDYDVTQKNFEKLFVKVRAYDCEEP